MLNWRRIQEVQFMVNNIQLNNEIRTKTTGLALLGSLVARQGPENRDFTQRQRIMFFVYEFHLDYEIYI